MRVTDADGAEIEAPTLRELGPSLGATPVLLDGELVAGDLWIGDLLHLDGRDVAGLPFRERHALLADLSLTGPHWRLAPVFSGGGAEVVAAVREQRLGGVLAKDADAPYEPGRRSGAWVAVDAPGGGPGPRPRRGRPSEADQPAQGALPGGGVTKAQVIDYYVRGRRCCCRTWPAGRSPSPAGPTASRGRRSSRRTAPGTRPSGSAG